MHRIKYFNIFMDANITDYSWYLINNGSGDGDFNIVQYLDSEGELVTIDLSNGSWAFDGRFVSTPLPRNKFVPFNERKTECSHDMIEYIGFTERYNHCRHCGIKE